MAKDANRFLFTSDIHLTDRPLDEYRWDIFRWMRVQATNREVSTIFILGDLTDRKDNHSAQLVDRIYTELRLLAEVAHVVILKGNHDYIDPKVPFFGFLDRVGSGIDYVTDAIAHDFDDCRFLMLPHEKRWRAAWDGIIDDSYDFVLLHATVNGSVASNGVSLSGVPHILFDKERVGDARVIAGDIHVPQRVGNVIYCGSPHPVRFADTYAPRVLFWDGAKLRSIKRTSIRKEQVVTDSSLELDPSLTEGDQVRVTVRLDRTDFGEWEEKRTEVMAKAESRGLVLCGIQLEEIEREGETLLDHDDDADDVLDAASALARFCEERDVAPAIATVGKEIMELCSSDPKQ